MLNVRIYERNLITWEEKDHFYANLFSSALMQMWAIYWTINLVLQLKSCWLKLFFGLWNWKNTVSWGGGGLAERKRASAFITTIVSLVTRHHSYILVHFLPLGSGFHLNIPKPFLNLGFIATFRKGPQQGCCCCCCHRGAHVVMTVTGAALHQQRPKLRCQIAQQLCASLSKTVWSVVSAKSRELHQGELFDLFFTPRLPHDGRSSINHVTEAKSRVEGSPRWEIISSLLQRVKQQRGMEIKESFHPQNSRADPLYRFD